MSVPEPIKSVKKGHTYVQWIAALLANSITLSYGLESGWISGTTRHLKAENSPAGSPIPDIPFSWIASAMSLSAPIGVSAFAYIANRYGSKLAVILLCGPQLISWLIKILYPTPIPLIIARTISGISAGGTFSAVPLYVKEISQDNMRGILGALLILMANAGVFIMYVLGAYLDYHTIQYVAVAIEIASVILMLKAPQSPSFLVKQEKIEEATAVVAFLRGLDKDDERIQKEVEHMKSVEAEFQARANISIFAILKDPIWRRGFLLVIATFIIHDACGAYVIITYAFVILLSTGVKFDIRPELQIISLPCVMVISSLMLTVVVERFGRKTLLSSAFFIMSLAMFALGSAILLQQLGWTVPNWLPILAMVLIVFTYGSAVCPLPYIILTEMFSYQVRTKIMGVIVTCAWFTSSMSVFAYAPISAAFGDYSLFFICGVVNLIGTIYVAICLPETKGKNDDEIQQMLARKVKSAPTIGPNTIKFYSREECF